VLDLTIEGGDQLADVLMSTHPTEASRGTDDGSGDPAQQHRSTLPVLHVAREASNPAVEVLDQFVLRSVR